MEQQIDENIDRMSQNEERVEHAQNILDARIDRFGRQPLPLDERLAHLIHMEQVVGQVDDVEHNDGQVVGGADGFGLFVGDNGVAR